ncbi:MAG: formylglycine-generating enzyme family protein [Treponema sp.]|jgi:formylglycine-generating enzyme required for sulfatase activity|nr:formylglycine-generating enzyme family protein [Treponema sp.]
MMLISFQELVNHAIQEQGIAILENSDRCKTLLYSYAKGAFKREIRRFLQSLEIGGYQELLASEEPDKTAGRLIERLQDEYMILQEEAEETIGLLKTLTEGQPEHEEETVTRLQEAAEQGDYHAKYTLGTVFEHLKRYKTSSHWFKEAAQQCIALYEEALEKPQPLPVPETRVQPAGNQDNEAGKASKPVSAETGGPASSAQVEQVKKAVAIPNDFVKIEGGSFMMGSSEREKDRTDNEISHLVSVNGFYMSKYEVTQQEYEQVMKMNPSHFKGPNLPVENVSWHDAVAYCNARSGQEGFNPVYTLKGEAVRCNWHTVGYRLPTEAEWEYACRAQTFTAFNTGDHITTDQANYDGNYFYTNGVRGLYREKTTPVGTFAPNSWGLYDMHGNVWEWCWDWYGVYDTRKQSNPAGPNTGADRVIRGGSWGGSALYLRSANRCSNNPFSKDSYLGFRVLIPCEEEIT